MSKTTPAWSLALLTIALVGCADGTKETSPCGSNLDCDEGTSCDLNGNCVDEVQAEPDPMLPTPVCDCSADEICVDRGGDLTCLGDTKAPCTSNAECASDICTTDFSQSIVEGERPAMACAEALGDVGDLCFASRDCAEDCLCDDALEQPECRLGENSACEDDKRDQCASGLRCIEGTCQPLLDYLDSGCNRDDDCDQSGPRLICDRFYNEGTCLLGPFETCAPTSAVQCAGDRRGETRPDDQTLFECVPLGHRGICMPLDEDGEPHDPHTSIRCGVDDLTCPDWDPQVAYCNNSNFCGAGMFGDSCSHDTQCNVKTAGMTCHRGRRECVGTLGVNGCKADRQNLECDDGLTCESFGDYTECVPIPNVQGPIEGGACAHDDATCDTTLDLACDGGIWVLKGSRNSSMPCTVDCVCRFGICDNGECR